MYGALVTAADSTRTGLRDWLLAAFRPRTSAPSTATILRSAWWPAAIRSVLHRRIVLTLNGNITDDFKPVYRAVLNFRRGWDIYNEHFDYVDPHYLYPPGGTLIMAPFGYLPFTESRYLFVAINSAAIVLAGYVLLRMFNFKLTSVAAPALLLAMFCTESVTSTLVFTNINGCVLLAEVLFLRWLLDGEKNHEWWAGVAIGLTLTLIHLVDIPVTNASVNPARSTAPAIFVGGWALQQLWLFWVAPLVGGALGGGLYHALFEE